MSKYQHICVRGLQVPPHRLELMLCNGNIDVQCHQSDWTCELVCALYHFFHVLKVKQITYKKSQQYPTIILLFYDFVKAK